MSAEIGGITSVRESKASKIVSAVVFGSLVLSVIYIIIRIIIVPGENAAQDERPESEYILMLLQCTMGILIMFVPGLISKKFSVEIPNWMHIVFVLFLFCAIFLGEVRNFYYHFRQWDAMLHAVSGGMLGSLGFSFVALLNKSERVPVNLSPVFVALFAFCFAVMLGVLWEVYEFTLDGLLGLNMQKFALENGTPLTGRAALTNTMKDLILDCLGAFVMSVIGYISLKYKKGWVESMLIKRIKPGTKITADK
jgi:hypothetical protein